MSVPHKDSMNSDALTFSLFMNDIKVVVLSNRKTMFSQLFIHWLEILLTAGWKRIKCKEFI